MKKLSYSILFVAALLFTGIQKTLAQTAFTPGNLVVYRVGIGTGTLTSSATPVIIDEYTTSGTLVQSIPMPTATSGTVNTLTGAGNAQSEGLMTTSVDGHYLLLTGYDAPVGTPGVIGSSVARVVGIVDVNANINTSTALTDFASTNVARSVVSTNGNDIWVAGATTGVRYTTKGSTTSTQLNTTTNLRQINIFNGQLYVTATSTTAANLGAVGTGTPTTTGQTITTIPGFPTVGSPYAFYFADMSATVPGVDVLYVAGSGIQKYSLVSGSWVSNGTAATGSVFGLTANVSGGTVYLYATNPGTTGNGAGPIFAVADASGYNGTITATPTIIATAANNEVFRGIAFAPCYTPTITAIASNGPICANQDLVLSATVTPTSTYTYSWAGSGTFSSSSVSSPTVTSAASGTYSVTVSNGCGVATTTINVTVNPSPTITVNGGAICSGDSYTLNPSGATTYTYSSGSSIVSPTSNASYSITGTDGNGCTSATPAVATVTVNPLPIITVNGGVICSGNSYTLNPSGATTYTYSGGSSIVSPTSNTSYSITGTDGNGCTSATPAVATVTVNALPSISVNSATVCVSQQTATLTAGGAATYTWAPATDLNTTTGSTVYASPATSGTTIYTVTGTDANGCVNAATNTVVANPLPSAIINPISSACAPICITIMANTGIGVVSYNWDFGNGQTSSVINPVVCYTIAGTYTVNLTLTDANGCVNTDTASITVNPAPTASLNITSPACNDATSNYNTPGIIKVVTTSGTTPFSYHWYDTQAYAMGDTLYTGFATDSVQVADGNGCSLTLHYSLTQPPPIHVTIGSIVDSVFCIGSCYSIPLKISGGTTPYKIYWIGPPTDVSNSQSITDSTANYYICQNDSNDLYDYQIWDSLGCGPPNYSSLVVNVQDCSTGIANYSNNVSVNLYPNPSKGEFTIETVNYTNNSVLTIYNNIGQLVYSTILTQSVENISTKLVPGMYNLHIQNTQGIITKHMVITD